VTFPQPKHSFVIICAFHGQKFWWQPFNF